MSDVNANSYTVGHDIVFGAGRFAPGKYESFITGMFGDIDLLIPKTEAGEIIRAGIKKNLSLKYKVE
ncbi:MAG: hypothetical protein WCE94_11165 [Candidatus Methanoperedens sp.]